MNKYSSPDPTGSDSVNRNRANKITNSQEIDKENLAPRCKMICETAASNSGGFITNHQDSSDNRGL